MVRALAIAGRDEHVEVQEVSIPGPGAGEVSVRVEAASLNGIDASVAAGYLWDMFPHAFPVVLGRDFAGIVEAVGEGVDQPSVGEKVAGVITAMTLCRGSIAETVVADAGSLVAVPLPAGGRLASALGATAEAVGRDHITVIPVMGTLTPRVLGELLGAVANGGLTVPVARTYPLGCAAQALADFGSPKRGKLVVVTDAR